MTSTAFFLFFAGLSFFVGWYASRLFSKHTASALLKEQRIALAVLGHVLPEGWSGAWRHMDMEGYLASHDQALHIKDECGVLFVSFTSQSKRRASIRPLVEA